MHPEPPSTPPAPRRAPVHRRLATRPKPRRRTTPIGVGALLALVFLGGSQAVGFAVPVAAPPTPQQAPPSTATGDGAPLDLAPPPPLAESGQPTAAGTTAITGTTAPGSSASTLPATQAGSVAIPAVVLTAYRRAESAIAVTTPGCHLSWTLLSAIGQVESGQADNGDVSADGTTLQPILGPLLDGSNGSAAIRDASGNWVRAEGPMQFLPSTWAAWGTDGNGDGRADPNNIFDAALAAGHYLCAGSRDLNQSGDLSQAILSYNHSDTYLATVLAWISYYQHNGVTAAAPVTPTGTTATTAPTTAAAKPSATTGAPTTAPTTARASSSPTTAAPSPSTSAGSGKPSPTPDPSASPSSPTSATPTPSPSATSGSPTACPSDTTQPTGGTPAPTPSAAASSSPPATPAAGTTTSPTPSASATACGSATPSPTTASPSAAVPSP